MTRSNCKGPYINFENKKISRNSKIMPIFINSTFSIYNGKSFSPVTVTTAMVGYKFGEFVFTRGRYEHKKKKKKKLRGKKK